MSFWEDFWYRLGISWAGVAAVAISTLVIYLAMTALIRLRGQRLFANHSSSGIVVTLVVGSISARAMLGNSPTLFGWLVATTMVVVLESIIGNRYFLGLKRTPRKAVVIFANGEPIDDALARYHLSTSQLWSTLRLKGITQLSQVKAVLLEPSGSLTIVRDDLDERLRADIRDIHGKLK